MDFFFYKKYKERKKQINQKMLLTAGIEIWWTPAVMIPAKKKAAANQWSHLGLAK
jgi:hypothetical protein